MSFPLFIHGSFYEMISHFVFPDSFSLLEATAKRFAFCNRFSIELFFRLHEKSPFC